MKTNVYFVRHAEPDISVKDDLIRPLSEKGLLDTKRVTKTLLDKDITAIYSSHFKRAVDTVKDLADTVKIDIIKNENLCERRVGKWVEDYTTFSKNQWSNFDFKLDGGESLREVQYRNISTLYDIIKDNSGNNIVIGTHGTALSTIINYFDSNYGYDGFMKIIDKMPYVLCLTFEDDKLEGMEELAIL